MSETNELRPIFNMSDRTYDTLKRVVQYILPGLATLYITLSGLWGWDYQQQIAGTITAVNVFLGIFVGISNRQYVALHGGTDGDLLIDAYEDGYSALTVALNEPADNLSGKDEVRFKVVRSNHATQE